MSVCKASLTDNNCVMTRFEFPVFFCESSFWMNRPLIKMCRRKQKRETLNFWHFFFLNWNLVFCARMFNHFLLCCPDGSVPFARKAADQTPTFSGWNRQRCNYFWLGNCWLFYLLNKWNVVPWTLWCNCAIHSSFFICWFWENASHKYEKNIFDLWMVGVRL